MKHSKFWFTLLCAALPHLSWGATELCGELSAPIEMNRQQSPYIITGDLWVPKGSRLTINSGAVILVRDRQTCKKTVPQWDYADSQRVSIKIEGALYINGTAEHPVVIKPETGSPSRLAWDGIRVRKGGAKRVQIESMKISGADRALRVENSHFNVGNSLFEGNNIGVELRSAADLNLYNNVFARNSAVGIDQKGSCPNIQANIFWRNVDAGIRSDSRRSPVISYNLFWENGVDCYRCEVGTAKPLDGARRDKFSNLFADPVWYGSASEARIRNRDPKSGTPAGQGANSKIQNAESQARAKGQAGPGLKPSGSYTPAGNGPYRLSQYSPALGAAPKNFFFNNANGLRGDLGMFGGLPERSSQEYP